jgi:hypothetical protein
MLLHWRAHSIFLPPPRRKLVAVGAGKGNARPNTRFWRGPEVTLSKFVPASAQIVFDPTFGGYMGQSRERTVRHDSETSLLMVGK